MSFAAKGTRRVSLLAEIAKYKTLCVFGHTNYVRFILLTRSRTGSNLLLSFLNAHPEIFAEGEIFARLRGRDPIARLESAFGRQPRRIKAKGFKLFYYHPLDVKADQLWSRLAEVNDIRVIHLTRENVLRTLLSRKIAGIQDAWTGTRFDAVGAESKRVEFTVQELEEGFALTRKWERDAASRFRDHPVLSISYEGIVTRPSEVLSQICAFLEVRPQELRTSLRRQNPESLRELVRNYDELKSAFASTEWESYFVD